MNKFRILLGVIFLLLFSISAFYLGSQFINRNKKQACTQEAKLCPDGSTVSRTGPNCEFAPCPQNEPAVIQGNLMNLSYQIPDDWLDYDKDFQGLHFLFNYPQGYEIEDRDQDSGNISIRNKSKDTDYLEMERFSGYSGGLIYSGEPFNSWLTEELIKYDENLPVEKISFTPINFANGNIFYLVETKSQQTIAFLESDKDYYFGIFNEYVVLIIDHKKFNTSDVYKILQSLAINIIQNKASYIKGSVMVYHVYETSLDVQLAAESSAGNITEMQIWTDSKLATAWQPYDTLATLLWESNDKIYALFRDNLGNISEVYSDTISPPQGPPN